MSRFKEVKENGVVIGCYDNLKVGRFVSIDHPEYRDWLSQGNTPDPADVVVETWLDKRLKSIPDGGYGSIAEQLEMIGEQGMAAYQTHIALVKAMIPTV